MSDVTIIKPEEEVLTVEEAAKLLRVSKAWIYQEAQAGRLPAYKVGRNVRFTRPTLLAWLERQRTAAPVAATLGRG